MTEGYGFLRFLFTKYSESEYVTEAWTPINEILQQFLQNSVENFQPMSYQAIYCHIYKSTCKGYKERLFDDLKKLVTEHCHNLKIQLDESMKRLNDDRSNRHMTMYILQFINYLHQFHRAMEVIVPLFHYLDVVYVKPKIRSTVQQELLSLYKTIIIEPHIHSIFIVLRQLMHTSDSPSKETIGLLLQMIHDITPSNYVELKDRYPLRIRFKIASAMKQVDLFKRYCNDEDVVLEMTPNGEDMITSASRTTSKRSVDELPGEEDQPSAKRTTNMVKSPH